MNKRLPPPSYHEKLDSSFNYSSSQDPAPLIGSLFKNDINRPVNPVITADDQSSLAAELSEFIITDEIERQLDQFLDIYLEYHRENGNGVWISGFFGSGKSHLLKMLAAVLSGRKIDGRDPVELFFEHNSDTLKPRFINAIKQFPCQNLLFNVDAKTNKVKSEAAVLKVFMYAFNEGCGYCSDNLYIAELERQLDEEGLFESFKKQFAEENNGKSWEQSRNHYALINKKVSRTLAAIYKDSPEDHPDPLGNIKAGYNLSVESFAQKVKAYIDRRRIETGCRNFRLNFFVDEIGQYVAGNIGLMLNLQTVSEQLKSKCGGGSWIFVTAQEDMEKVIGTEEQTRQGNDFSKIQDRFPIRFKLSSKNVKDVIVKRLLNKTDRAEAILSQIYEDKHDNFKTLFSFTDDSRIYEEYGNDHDFIDIYPFIPYQFGLFQDCIKGLSDAGFFEGNFNSTGERSMLGVFHTAAVSMKNTETGHIASLDLMFDALRGALISANCGSLLEAERDLAGKSGKERIAADKALKLIKILLLVRNVKQFKSTVSNLTVLMQGTFNDNRRELQRDVEEGLNYLLHNHYITKDGPVYQYLSDEEKIIEREIASESVEYNELNDKICDLFFIQAAKLETSKIRDEEMSTDRPFTKMVDGNKIRGRTEELAVNLITPFAYDEQAKDPDDFKIRYQNDKQITVVLPNDRRLRDDLLTYVKTDKFIRGGHFANDSGVRKNLCEEKSAQNNRLRDDLIVAFNNLGSEIRIYSLGQDISDGKFKNDTKETTLKQRITGAFICLTDQVYTKRKLLENAGNFFKHDLATVLVQKQLDQLSAAENEVLNRIISAGNDQSKLKVSALIDHFKAVPFGWYPEAILTLLAMLCSRGRIEFTEGGITVKKGELAAKLVNTVRQKQLTAVLTEAISRETIILVKSFAKEYFNDFNNAYPDDSEGLLEKICGNFNERAEDFKQILEKSTSQKWPLSEEDNKSLNKVIDFARRLQGDPKRLFKELPECSEEFMKDWNNSLAKLSAFVHNDKQIKQYQEAVDKVNFLGQNFDVLTGNLNTALGEKFKELKQALYDQEFYTGPNIRKIKSCLSEFKDELDKQEVLLRSDLSAQLEHLQQAICKDGMFTALNKEDRDAMSSFFAEKSQKISSAKNYSELYLLKTEFVSLTAETYEHLERIASARENSAEESNAEQEHETVLQPVKACNNDQEIKTPAKIKATPPITRITELSACVSAVSEKISSRIIATPEDADHFLEELRKAILQSVADGRRVVIH